LRRCIDYVMAQSEDVKREVLSGIYSKDAGIKGYGELAEDQAWANHSYYKRYYEWSLAEWRLATEGAGASLGQQRLAFCKSSYCLLFLAAEIRREAYDEAGEALKAGKVNMLTWKSYFREADRCLHLALIQTREFMRCNEDLPAGSINREFVIYYNNACSYSLLAQYEVEASIPAWRPSAKGRELCERLLERRSDCAEEAEEDEVWTEIGKNWRRMLSKGEVKLIQKRADRYARLAIQNLEAIKYGENGSTRYFPTGYLDTSFIARRARIDPDLTFLRCDGSDKTRHDFEKWCVDRTKSRRGFFTDYYDELPDEVKQAVKSLQDHGETDDEP